MTHLSLYDPRIDPRAAKTLLEGDTITILEYETSVITDGKRVGTDGGVFPGPFKDQNLWKPLYQSVNSAINQDVDGWIIQNIDTISLQVMKFPYKIGLFSLSVSIGLTDGGKPFLDAKYTPQSDLGKEFIRSPAGARARLMALEIAGDFINKLGREFQKSQDQTSTL